MTVFIYQCFELLKEYVLEEAGIVILTTADCSILSSKILLKTKKSISETTLKRIYGFANSRFKPSPFTLNTLSQYCGYKSWVDFCSKREEAAPDTLVVEHDIYSRADTITRNTLQALKNRSSIPFQHTIDRRIIYEHISEFEKGNYLATILVGPTGSGKTIGLCHWLNGRIALNSVTNQNDVYLLFSSHVINTSLLYDSLEQWLLSLLGVQTSHDFISLFTNNNKKLYFIIDGFDDYLFKTGQFDPLINQIIDIVACYKEYSWFKLILTMTSVTWSSFQSRINHFYLIRDRWYLGLIQDNESFTRNLTPLSYDELMILSEKINPGQALPKKLNDEVLQFLSHPEYFSYFYHSNTDHFSFGNAKPAFVYDLLSKIILDKIYKSRHSTDNITIIKSLVRRMNWQKQQSYVSKDLFYDTIKQYPTAYRELTNQGILYETNASNPLHYNENIHFGNNHLGRYFLAKRLLDENNDQISQQLINDAQNAVIGNDDYLGVLKWIILYAISENNFLIFSYLSHIKLYSVEKATLMIFICDHLNEKHSELYYQKDFNQFLQKDFIFFNTFLKIQFLNPQYHKSISHLLRFNLSGDKRLLIRCLIIVSDILGGNLESAKKSITELSETSDDTVSRWPLNPILDLQAIVHYFVYGHIEKACFGESTHILFHPENLNKYKSVYDAVFVIAIYANLLLNNYKKSARFIQIIRNAVPHINGSISPELNFCMSMVDCKLAVYNGENQRASALYTFILNRFHHQQSYFSTTIRLFFLLLKAQVVTILQKEDDLLTLNKQVSNLSASGQYVFFDMLNKAFLINTSNINHLAPEEIQSIYLSLVKLVRAKGLRLESFIHTYSYDTLHHKMKSSA